MADKVYLDRHGDGLTVEAGGSIDIAAGGRVVVGGALMAMVAAPVAGVTAGMKVAAGEVTLDGTNPTSVATGLATVVAAVACYKQATVLGDDPNSVTVDYAGLITAGQLDIYAGKNATGTDPTQIASTSSTAVVSWVAIGT